MENLQLSYPAYYLILISVIALIYAISLYVRAKNLKENKKWLPLPLGLLRFLSILTILFLLLAPLLKQILEEKQKPIIAILKDKSGSIDQSEMLSAENQLNELKNQLAGDYDLIELEFAENLKFTESDTVANNSTNISAALNHITEAYGDQNLAGTILVSDGIYNEGVNPLYDKSLLQKPIYSVGLGDTTQRRDLILRNVLHNRIAYLNDQFKIEADIQAFNCLGNSSQLSLFEIVDGKRKLLKSETIKIDKVNYFQTITFELLASRPGNIKYEISASKISDEVSSRNNSRNIYMEILDARQKVLIFANAPHPDIKALKTNILRNKNYELDIIYAKDKLDKISLYDIVILHDLPNGKNKVSTILDQINRLKKPVWFIVGENTSSNLLNSNQEVFTLKGSNSSLNDVTVIFESSFDLFTSDEILKRQLTSFVPLRVPFGTYETNPTAKVFLKQKIGNVDTDYPLLGYTDYRGHKQAVLAGEGLWRWNLYEYQEYAKVNHTYTIINKTLQYISEKEDKRQFRAYANQKSYKENETVFFDAQLYNANLELINTPEVSLTLSNQKKESFEFNFSKTADQYILDAGKFPSGSYAFIAKTTYQGKALTAKGSFIIESIEKEQFDLTARHDLLFALSNQTDGDFMLADNISSLGNTLLEAKKAKPIIYQKSQTTPLLNSSWLLGIIIILLALEWFFRRYFGAY